MWMVGSPCSPRDSQESSPTPQFKSISSSVFGFFIVHVSHPYMITGKILTWSRRTFAGKVMSLLFNKLCRLVRAFLPRSKCLLTLWLQSPSAVILEPKEIKSVTVSIVSPSICYEVMGLDSMIFVFWKLNFKPVFSLSTFTSSKDSLVPLHFLPKGWFHVISELPTILISAVLLPVQHFSWCPLHIS